MKCKDIIFYIFLQNDNFSHPVLFYTDGWPLPPTTLLDLPVYFYRWRDISFIEMMISLYIQFMQPLSSEGTKQKCINNRKYFLNLKPVQV